MFSHLDAQNRPAMVNVGDKPVTKRTAHAVAVVALPPPLAALLRDGEIATKKGPIFQTAILAGVIAKLTIFSPGVLATVPTTIRLGAVLIGFLAFTLMRRSVFAGVLAGEAALILGALLFA